MRIVLRPACSVCGQTLRSNDWIEVVGRQPVSIAHELTYCQNSIERRDLPLGEKASRDAFVVKEVDEDGDPVFSPALGREAPDGWRDQLTRSLIRSAKALGLKIEEDNTSKIDLYEVAPDEFRYQVRTYILDAERMVEEAKAELEFRRIEATNAIKKRGLDV